MPVNFSPSKAPSTSCRASSRPSGGGSANKDIIYWVKSRNPAGDSDFSTYSEKAIGRWVPGQRPAQPFAVSPRVKRLFRALSLKGQVIELLDAFQVELIDKDIPLTPD